MLRCRRSKVHFLLLSIWETITSGFSQIKASQSEYLMKIIWHHYILCPLQSGFSWFILFFFTPFVPKPKLSLSGKTPDHHSSQCWFMLLLWFLQLFAARFWLPGENMTLKGWDWNCTRAGNEIFNGFTSLHSPGALPSVPTVPYNTR